MQITSKPKKRLALMPEVLPAPTRSDHGQSSVRQRTVGHMHKMIAAAGALASCTRPVTQPDNTMTIPAPSAPSASTSVTTTVTPPMPSLTASVTPPIVPPVPTPTAPATGYMVVDMLPSPARCYGAAASMTAVAVWKQDATGFYAEVVITHAGATNTTLLPKSVNVWGGALMSAGGTPAQVTLRVRPNPGNTSFGASLDVMCGSQSGTVIANAQLSGAKKVGDKLPVTVIDR